jgi:hypothetical protein
MAMPPPALPARLPYTIGLEIPGRLAIAFAARPRYEGDPRGRPRDERIREAMAAIEDGPVALAASEPAVARARLARPAQSVTEAADAAVYALGERILDAPEPPSVRHRATM